MSADNGIYILKTPAPKGSGFEFRVKEFTNVEDLTFENVNGNPYSIVGIYIDVTPFASQDYALSYAHDLYDINENEGGIIEYGIQIIEFEKTFMEFVILAIPQIRQILKDTINKKIRGNFEEKSKLYLIQRDCELLNKLLEKYPNLREDVIDEKSFVEGIIE